jgi:cation-transporting ATPase 13A1
MLFVFESTVVNSRLRNLRQIRQMATKPQLIYVYRAGKWQQVSSIDLLPNDVVSVSRHDPEKPDQVCACDILLMKGKAVTNESLLTGESTPQMKDSISDTYTTEDDKFVLDLKKRDKRHIIFGGTRVLQAWPPNPSPKFIPPPPDRGCIGVVLRTGFETSQGKLLRTILYATERVTANNLEALLFIGFLLIFAVTASAYVMYKGLLDPDRSRYKLFLNCTLIITSVVPPELPMELSLAVNTSLLALSKLGIFCTEPFRIPYAGRVQVCCFDKTGTLTSDKMLLKSIVTSSSQTQNNSTTSWPDNARIVLAGCHSLIELEGKMLGDPMEQAGVAGTDFKFSEEKSGAGDTLISMSSKGAKKVKIMRRFAFDSDIKRMSTISHITFGQHKVLRVLVKGAPEALKPLFSATSVPKDYDDSVRELTRRGGRVIALAQKDLPESASSMIDRLSRDQVESELEFVAFAVFESDIKQRTAETITALRDSSHRVVMITGDNPLTACHVARQLHMIRKPLLVLSHKNDDDQFLSWVDENFNTLGQVTGESFHDTLIVSELAPKYDLCVSGEALSFLLRKRIGKANTEQGGRLMDDWIDVYSRYANVFARVSPDQKEHILTSLKSQGFWTLMCGDGTNDVGALKQAHVGVALIDQLPQHQQNQQKQNTSEPSSRQEALRKLQEHQGSFGEVVDTTATKKKTFRELLEEVRKQQEKEAEGENLVRLGDASIASPFTSRIPNIAATADIIRQGRCTLATTMQMYKILALNCLVSAYSLSVLYLDGVKFGDSQMMLTGFGIAMCFLFISRSKPVEKLSKTRPHTRIFSAYMMTSIMGQFLIHLVTLFLTVQASKLASPPDLQISRSIGTERERSFEPNLLNTVVFIVTSLQTVVTFVNNYCGRPFMESLFENRPLFMILMGLGASCFACATGLVPQLNHTLELVPIDDIGFRSLLVIMLVGNIVAVTFFEQLCSRLFPAEEEENGKFEEN